MPIYTLELIARRETAHHTWVFSFNKPAGLHYKPGQYGGFTLIQPPETDAGGITRRFSLMSSPDDNDLAIVTRLQNSAFKRVLGNLPLGSPIKFAGPTGTFVLHDEIHRPAVFIAGGIGIAPFHSMIKQACALQRPQPITLFYGNTTRLATAFLPEMQAFEKSHAYFKMIPTFDQEDESWTGEKGFITDKLIQKYVPDLTAPIYYVCGAPAMVNALQTTLASMNIPADQIRVEDFPGY